MSSARTSAGHGYLLVPLKELLIDPQLTGELHRALLPAREFSLASG